jgi:hypothetical protein
MSSRGKIERTSNKKLEQTGEVEMTTLTYSVATVSDWIGKGLGTSPWLTVGNPPDKPKAREVEFSKKEVLREEVKIYRRPDHGCPEAC